MARGAVLALVLALALALAAAAAAAQQAALRGNGDAVTALPGYTGPALEQYAGYVNVDAAHGRELFYWYIAAEDDAAGTAPVVLWLTGGPGCSSVSALLSENGPFWAAADGTLQYSTTGWTRAAHMVWLESPAGVGFSYSATRADYTTGDVRTADDAYAFLLGFFARYPQLAARGFFISGESYGGHYVPELALRIVQGNAQGGNPRINLKGFLVGNPWTDAPVDNLGAVQFWFDHGIISNSTYVGFVDNCDFTHIGPLAEAANDACSDAQTRAQFEMRRIFIYDIYSDVCLDQGGVSRLPHHAYQLARLLRGSRTAVAALAQDPTPPCIDNYVTAYMNRKDVQEALHARPTQWEICSSVVNYSYTDLLTSVVPVYSQLFKSGGLRIMVYSGDVDGIVPFTGTRMWIDRMPLTPTASVRRPWLVDGQTGGWVEDFAEMTWVTVRGAGHMVPGTQPERALVLFSKFVADTPL